MASRWAFLCSTTALYVLITSASPVRSLSINPAYQGQGIAKAAVAAHRLDAVVRQHDPDSQRLILGVNRCNTVARDLYLAAGFYDTGVYINGVAGAQHIFQRKFA